MHVHRKFGQRADYGSIYFPKTKSTAQFMTVSDSTSPTLLATYMETTWKLTRPDIVISVTGGAQDFQLSPKLRRIFHRGLASAAASAQVHAGR